MTVYITYFAHGTTTDNERGLLTGQQDGILSERGIAEAKELARLTADKNFDAVFSSDLKRAFDSAELGFGARYPIVRDARLRECDYGDSTGKPSRGIVDVKYIRAPFPNGESYEDVERRMSDFCAFLKKNDDGKHVVLVSHRFPQLALDVLLKRKTWEEALAEDWRRTQSWQAGWKYFVS